MIGLGLPLIKNTLQRPQSSLFSTDHLCIAHRRFSRLYSSAIPPPYENQQFFDRFIPLMKNDKFKAIVKRIIAFLCGTVSLSAVYVVLSHEIDEKRLRDTLVRGTCPSINVDDSDFIHRPSVEADFERMITPKEKETSYFVVAGEHGTGKSTMMKAACSKIGGGIIYIDVPENVRKFGDVFADAIGFKFHPSTDLFEYIHGLVYGPGTSTEPHQGTRLYDY